MHADNWETVQLLYWRTWANEWEWGMQRWRFEARLDYIEEAMITVE